MSLPPSGSEILRQTHSVMMADSSQVGEARRLTQSLSHALKFESTRQGRVAVIVNELGNNLVRYAQRGELLVRAITDGGRAGVEVLAIDRGPGLNPDIVMKDGYSSGSTPGTGLGAVNRMADEFDIFSTPQKGTIVMARIYADEKSAQAQPSYEVGAISVPMKGETVCGDGWNVFQQKENLHLAVVDGLGHGPLAHQAAVEAAKVFESEPLANPERQMQVMHSRLKSTRGAAVFLAAVQSAKIDFVGVGNVGASVRDHNVSRSLISQNGTAGLQIRSTMLRSEPWERGYFTLCSDGILTSWNLSAYPGAPIRHPSIIAGLIYRDFLRGTDDATVVVVRRRG